MARKERRYARALCRCRWAARRIDRRRRTHLDRRETRRVAHQRERLLTRHGPTHGCVATLSSWLLKLCALGRALQPCFARWAVYRLGLFRALDVVVHDQGRRRCLGTYACCRVSPGPYAWRNRDDAQGFRRTFYR